MLVRVSFLGSEEGDYAKRKLNKALITFLVQQLHKGSVRRLNSMLMARFSHCWEQNDPRAIEFELLVHKDLLQPPTSQTT